METLQSRVSVFVTSSGVDWISIIKVHFWSSERNWVEPVLPAALGRGAITLYAQFIAIYYYQFITSHTFCQVFFKRHSNQDGTRDKQFGS